MDQRYPWLEPMQGTIMGKAAQWRALLIDDDPLSLAIVSLLAAQVGLGVDTFDNFEQARHNDDETVKVVVSDWQLDGLQATVFENWVSAGRDIVVLSGLEPTETEKRWCERIGVAWVVKGDGGFGSLQAILEQVADNGR
jgi:DNA-binding response OmpR family regulator